MKTALSCRPVVALLLLSGAGCGRPPGDPIARIDITPAFVCEGDTEQRVLVSGERSVGAGGTQAELDYAWAFSVEPLEIVRGSRSSAELVARFAARSPVSVRLDVEDREGRTGTRVRTLGLTRVASCDEGCIEETEQCVYARGAALCAPRQTCGGDDECGCLSCREDDQGARRCLP